MTAYRAQVVLHTADNIPENFVTNSWALSVFPDDDLDTGAVTTALKDFYDDLSAELSPVFAVNGHEVKYYLLPGTPPNYPFEEDTFNFGFTPSGTAFPDEVSIVLSFQGTRTAGLPQARRRGRLYIGPLRTSSATGNRPSSTAITNLSNAAATFKSNIEAIGTGDHFWSVWSTVDQSDTNIANGWIDNAFDTQRRRGVQPTSRTTFT